MDQGAASFYEAARQFPTEYAGPMLCVTEEIARKITEIRMRSARPVILSTARESLYLTQSGAVSASRPQQPLLFTPHAAVNECFLALCGYSVHSFEACIAQGFVPMRGGHRAGLCGTAVPRQNIDTQQTTGLYTVKNITSLNVRIARPSLCVCAPQLLALLDRPEGILLAGPPGSGKTTLLRAVVRALSEKGQRVAVVDERFEIAPVEQAGFATPLPLHCDVLSGYPKHTGMLHALRSLAPDVILCDEIGSMDDVRAIRSVANAGVRMLVTLHGASRAQLCARPQVQALLQTGAFRYLVVLAGKNVPGEILEVNDFVLDV